MVGGQAFIPVGERSDSIPADAPTPVEQQAEQAQLDSPGRVWQDTHMSTTDPYAFERETDEKLAALSYEQYRTLDRIDQLQAAIISATNPPYYYRGTHRHRPPLHRGRGNGRAGPGRLRRRNPRG